MSAGQRELLASYMKMAAAQRGGGRHEEALATYRKALALAERLAAPEVLIGGIHDAVGDILIARAEPDGALESYRSVLAISERLAAAQPGDPDRLRGLSLAHTKVGDVLRARRELSGALASYRAALGAIERAARAHPGNSGWQRDLAVSHGKLGSVLLGLDKRSDAAASYRAALAISERLAAADKSDATRQVDLAMAHWPLVMLDTDDPDRHLAFIVTTLRAVRDKGELSVAGASLLGSAENLLVKAQQAGARVAATRPQMTQPGRKPSLWSRLFGGGGN